jgi:hypothetical protein
MERGFFLVIFAPTLYATECEHLSEHGLRLFERLPFIDLNRMRRP